MMDDSLTLARLKGSRFECDKELAKAINDSCDEISRLNELLREQEDETEYWKYEAKYADKLDTISLYKKERKNNQQLRRDIGELRIELYRFGAGGVYEGEWQDNKRHGQGTCTSADGDEYKGEWRDDNWHGQGTYTKKAAHDD
jgi:hypothetical protein